MKKKPLINCFKYLALWLMMLTLNLGMAEAEGPPSFVRLSGHIPSQAVSKAVFLNDLDPNWNVTITFTFPLRNENELNELLQGLYDPSDVENYGKYLSSEEFIERFAPTEEDYQKVLAYAEEMGLSVTEQHSNRLLLTATGQTKTLESAFKLNLHHYQLPNGRKFYAPNNEPLIPSSVASVIQGVIGLDNHAVWKPHHRFKQTPSGASGEIQAHSASPEGFSPQDIVNAYNLTSVDADGSGQIIALFQLGSYLQSDIDYYSKTFGLPPAKLKHILVGGGSHSGPDSEVTLDIELAHALAPQSQIYVYEGPNTNQGVINTYNRIATDNIAKQVSTSWGLGEDSNDPKSLQSENAIFKQMAAQGQTMYAAAGDSGAYDDYSPDDPSSKRLAVDDPASQPYVVGVGGTKLTVDSKGAYASESVWNDGLDEGAGGGGVSQFWAIPAWQKNIPQISSQKNRNVPDVSLNADPNTGYAIYFKGKWDVIGGTSCAAPLWASFTALVNQKRVAAQKHTLGFANPVYYAIGTGSSYAADFHDVADGDNLHYPAHPGYDNATGWGSLNGANLLEDLTHL